MSERWAKKENYRKIVNIICKKTAKGMKPRNKTVEMEMQGTRGLPSVSFIKQALPVCYWIDLFDDKNCISFSVESKWERK